MEQNESYTVPVYTHTQPIRYDWTSEEIDLIYNLPLPDLLYQAQQIHRQYHDPQKVQLCTLLSIKTGGCPEDCAYCPQSAHYDTEVVSEKILNVEKVLEAARKARANGSTRFCMGAAWREITDGEHFKQVLTMVQGVNALGMEVCCTLGMLNQEQANQLAEAGLKAYNHNLDTGPEYYEKIITTRTYEDRLQTLKCVREAGITVCCGGIVGMGEQLSDRISLLQVLANLEPHPESVPINALVSVEGTPLENQHPIDPIDMTRMIATARITMPSSRVRLSAGRTEMSVETQALCFLAGANSLFTGETLLTTPNPDRDHDQILLNKLGLSPLDPQ